MVQRDQRQPPRIDRSQLAGLIVETLLNGYFHVLLIQCLKVLYQRCKAENRTFFFKPLTLTSFVLFLTITGHWIVNISMAFEAFIQPRELACVDVADFTWAEKAYLNMASSKNVMRVAFYVAGTVVGDSFMIYRLSIIWFHKKMIVIPPIVLCIALAVTGVMSTYLISQNNQSIFGVAGPWTTTFFSLTFICNLYSTLLIAVRIFRKNLELMALGTDTTSCFEKIFELLIESAVLYSCCVIISLSTYAANSNIQFIAFAAANPVLGIIFCLIIPRENSCTRLNQPRALTPMNYYRSHHSGDTSRNSHGVDILPVVAKMSTQVEADSERIGSFENPREKGVVLVPPGSSIDLEYCTK